MNYFHWIAGTLLALAWFSRIVDAAIGMPSVADISRPEWDRNPVAPSGNVSSGNLPLENPRVSIIVPARNEEDDIEQSLTRLLELDYDNYEVIAVNDRSTDHTGEIMEKVSPPSLADLARLRVIHHRELPQDGWGRRMPCGRRRMQRTATGCCLPMPMCCSSLIRCGGPWLTPRRRRPTTLCCFRG